jgi:TetR/AcrR family transcriptional regulator, transcriptional repressor for nem operon
MARPTTYDESAVVAAAMEQFRVAGFNGSSVDSLVQGSRLNKHSLYQAFGGKDGLFLRALQEYLDTHSADFMVVFSRKRGYAALDGYFRAVLKSSDPRGCLVVNTAVEMGDSNPECQRLMSGYYSELAACFARAIEEGQEDGSIRSDLQPRDTAQWLVRAVQGLAVSNRLGGARRPSAGSILALLAKPGAIAS